MGKKIKVGITMNKAHPVLRKNYITKGPEVDNFARIQLTTEVQIDAIDGVPMKDQIHKEVAEIKEALDAEYQIIMNDVKALHKKYLK